MFKSVLESSPWAPSNAASPIFLQLSSRDITRGRNPPLLRQWRYRSSPGGAILITEWAYFPMRYTLYVYERKLFSAGLIQNWADVFCQSTRPCVLYLYGRYAAKTGALYTVRWKGSEGSKQTKHTTGKLTPCWFQKCNFFENLPTPFFWKWWFCKIRHLFALLALPVMIREEYRQMAHQTLPNILLSNASLVTKSCIASVCRGRRI